MEGTAVGQGFCVLLRVLAELQVEGERGYAVLRPVLVVTVHGVLRNERVCSAFVIHILKVQ